MNKKGKGDLLQNLQIQGNYRRIIENILRCKYAINPSKTILA